MSFALTWIIRLVVMAILLFIVQALFGAWIFTIIVGIACIGYYMYIDSMAPWWSRR